MFPSMQKERRHLQKYLGSGPKKDPFTDEANKNKVETLKSQKYKAIQHLLFIISQHRCINVQSLGKW